MDTIVRTFQGGSAKVEILERPDGFTYAKKTLTNTNLARRFKREVEYQGSFTHPNIVPVYEPRLDETPPNYVMPHALCTLLEYPKPTPSSFIFDVLTGLEAIHARGYSHRDLKPKNILIFKNINGGDDFAAISDFGLLDVPNSADTSQLTYTGMWGGTQSYSAPECFTDLRSADYRADFYSMGAILYDIYFDRLRVPCAELTGDGPIGSVIQRCTFSRPELRYNSVAELRSALQIALEGLSDDMIRQRALAALQYLKVGNISDISTIIQQVDILSSDDLYQEDFFRSLTSQLIELIKSISEPHFIIILENFCFYIVKHGFSFSYCDVLADLSKAFYSIADEDGQALIAVAVLELGVSHNRFYVEQAFFEFANPGISNSLALKMRNAAVLLELNLAEKVAMACCSLNKGMGNVHRFVLR